MKLKVNLRECIGCGACVAVAGNYFEIGGDGKSHVKGGKVDGDFSMKDFKGKGNSAMKEAVESCPVKVISVE